MRTHLLLLAVVATACGGTTAEESATTEGPPPVALGPDDIAVARVGEISSGVVLTGTLEPAESVELKAQVAGTLARLTVDRGDPVKRGQVIATIEARAIESEATGARVALTAAEAGLATAARQLEGARTLHEAGAMSDVDFQGVLSQYEAAQAQVAAARARLDAATEQAARTTIVSPITGVVSRRLVSVGEAVTPGQHLVTIVNSDTLELSGQITVRQASLVKVGQPVTFTLDAYPGQEFTGRVARIDPVADPATRQVGAALELPNREHRLIAGQFVTGKVVTANVGEALLVPSSAVRTAGGAGAAEQRFVLVIEDGVAVRRPVTTGATDSSSGMVAITSGLEEGEVVVATPSPSIQPGTRVRLPDDADAPASGDTR